MAYATSLAIFDSPKTFLSSNPAGTSVLFHEPKEVTLPQVSETHRDPLVQKLQNGDEETYEVLIAKYYSPMIRVASQYVPTHALAEEVVQETWLAFLESLGRFEGRCSIKTWLFRILTNRAKTRGVQEHRYVPLPGESHTKEETQKSEDRLESSNSDQQHHDSMRVLPQTCEHNNPEKDFLTKEAVTHIEAAIQALPPRHQQIIMLRDVEGWSPKEVCELLSLSEQNQRVLLHRARVRVRNELATFLQPSNDVAN